VSSLTKRYLAKPSHIWCATLPVQAISFQTKVTIRHSRKTFPFRLQTPFRDPRTVERLAELLEGHFDTATALFPWAPVHPRLWYNQDDPDDPHFVATLPPYTAIYTTYSPFFPALRLPGQRAAQRKIGGRGTAVVVTDCYGFFNASNQTIHVRSTEAVMSSLPSNLLLPLLLRPDLGNPPNVQIQVEHYDVNNKLQVLTMPHAIDGKAKAMELLNEFLMSLVLDYNFPGLRIEVSSGPYQTVYLTTQRIEMQPAPGFPNEPIDIIKFNVQFSAAVSEALGLDPNDVLSFTLGEAASHTLSIRSGNTDAFKDKFPITAVCQTYGDASSYIHGLGYVSLLGIMPKAGVEFHSKGMVLETDLLNLTLRFYDRDARQIAFLQDTEIHLTFDFESL
jgi:hypothetical protein